MLIGQRIGKDYDRAVEPSRAYLYLALSASTLRYAKASMSLEGSDDEGSTRLVENQNTGIMFEYEAEKYLTAFPLSKAHHILMRGISRNVRAAPPLISRKCRCAGH